ncbi:hypothetical protein [Vibrio phage vB_VpaM_VPs20]|uniref:Uncharacterized protein n=1 Tax=Vibrio phage vB_VpaM_VPs20 TaxID=2978980 RepID=A0A9X9JPY4_9CAUD|nr:hypothetical protein QNH06_gp28 [Vibrio phage vB_VpaM_VPs20]UYD72128.1 hypothetical protein [Vibrio phage vB_VpaM_VPs20]
MWSHVSPLYDGSESGVLNETITWSEGATEYSVTTDHDQSAFTVSADENGIYVNTVGDTLAGLFGVEWIRYLDSNYVEQEVYDWDDVPFSYRMSGFKPLGITTRVFTVTCDGVYVDPLDPLLEPVPMPTLVLDVIVYQEYTTNKLILQQKVGEEYASS